MFRGCFIPALAAAVLAAQAVIVGARKPITLQPISAGDQVKWKPRVARREVARDLANLVSAFDRDFLPLKRNLREFRLTREKDADIRKLALWGITLGRVHDMSNANQAPKIYARMRNMTDKLLTIYEEKHSYVENRTMRGWPMYVDRRDTRETFEVCT